MKQLTGETFASLVAEHDGLVVIDFYADWCGPCRMMAPVMEEIEKEYPTVAFYKVNVDAERDLAMKFHVESIPMIALVKDDTFLDMSLGYVPKDTVTRLIDEHL